MRLSRPIVIRFRCPEKRNAILGNRAPPFKVGEAVIKVVVAPDRTTQQREEFKLLQAELKKRRTDENDENLVIRNGKIVSRRPFRYKPQQFWGSHRKAANSKVEGKTTEPSEKDNSRFF